jgi:hypothetical protein
MKNPVALLGGTSWVLVWSVLAAPNVSTAQRLGAAPPAALATSYQSERAWAVGEIVSDINEIARYRVKRAEPPAFAHPIAPWQPELLAAYAASQLQPSANVKLNGNDPADQYIKLLEHSPDAILAANTVISAALKREMRNPRAHEAAALVLGAFGLRESDGLISDRRWVLNRMTAHLAIAQALRNGQSRSSIDGQLATATLLALANRQRLAVAAIDAIAPDTVALTAWQRALRMRVVQDWRILAAPAIASRLEKVEYFRARRATLRGTRAGQDLTDLREPVTVDFARIVQSRSYGVEDGNDFILEGLTNEIAELGYVYRQLHQRELPANLPAAIVNARGGRLLTNGDPQVVSWGAWAEFAQRHIGMSISQIDNHYRRMLRTAGRADELKRVLDARLGHLTLYPVASTNRTKGDRGTEADLSQIARAIDVAVRAPELVNYHFWNFLELGSKYEPVARAIPDKKTWFAPLSAAVPYDAGGRAETMLGPLQPPAIEALLDEAPYDLQLISRVVQRLHMIRPLMAKVRVLVDPRVDYDMWAIDSAINVAPLPADRIALRRKACQLSAIQCLQLAQELIASDEAAAVAEYEKAFRDPALDQVVMSNSTGWLVSYYERTSQLVKALDLAQRSAAVGSGIGLQTLAHLLERRARPDEADAVFGNYAARYPESGKPQLAGFLYRQAVIAKKPGYLARWQAAERELFPEGLQPMAAAMPSQPAKGVFVEQDSYWSKRVRLQAGDIIVGVDGWKVESRQQYDTVVAFLPAEAKHKLTAWRGVLFTVELGANHGMTLKTHPLKGWIE